MRRDTQKGSPRRSKSIDKGEERTKAPDRIVEKNVSTINQMEEAAKDVRSPSQIIAERIAQFCGSVRFVWVHVAWFGAWILINVIPGVRHVDPFPFTFLTLVVSLEAIFLSTFILISQNHDTQISEKRNRLDLQINLLSEQENTKMLAILRLIAEKVGADLTHDPVLETLSQRTSPEEVAKALDDHAADEKTS